MPSVGGRNGVIAFGPQVVARDLKKYHDEHHGFKWFETVFFSLQFMHFPHQLLQQAREMWMKQGILDGLEET